MATLTFQQRRGHIETYFDRTAREAWTQLTSDAPVSRIRATVRAGRDGMRATILNWLPADLRGRAVLDAGCGTGAMAVQLALKGAQVQAVDVSSGLIDVARARAPTHLGRGALTFHTGDMLDPAYGEFDHAIAMDSLIHYETADAIDALAGLAARTRRSLIFTLAPRTPALALMHAAGKFFPAGNRSPAIVPTSIPALRRRLAREKTLASWQVGRDMRVASGFYISHAVELVRSCGAG